MFLTGLTAALYACAATPPPSNSPTATVEAGHTLELNAVFWADKIHHRSNAWQRHQETFTFRLENIPASQVLELLSTELNLGYDIDSCGEMPVSIVGRNMKRHDVRGRKQGVRGRKWKIDVIVEWNDNFNNSNKQCK